MALLVAGAGACGHAVPFACGGERTTGFHGQLVIGTRLGPRNGLAGVVTVTARSGASCSRSVHSAPFWFPVTPGGYRVTGRLTNSRGVHLVCAADDPIVVRAHLPSGAGMLPLFPIWCHPTST